MCCITMCYTRLLLEFALSTCVRCEDPFYNTASFARSRSRSIDRERDHDIFSTIYFLRTISRRRFDISLLAP